MSDRPRPVLYLDKMAASPLDMAAGGLIVIIVILVGLVWSAALVSSWLVNGEVADVGLNEAGLALVRFGGNNLGWEGVWDPAVEQQLAGPGWFWIVFGIELFIVCLLFWPVWQLIGPRPPDPPEVVVRQPAQNHPRSARRREAREARSQARQQDMMSDLETSEQGFQKILISQPDGRRLVLGRSDGRLVATEKHHSVIVFGPNQSGKTSGLTVPALIEWRGPVLAAVAKADLLPLVWDERAELGGTTWLFDPTASATGYLAAQRAEGRRQARASSWSPLHLIEAVPRPRNEPEIDRRRQQWALARRTARWMVGATRPATETPGSERSVVVAEEMLAPLLFAAAVEELSIGRVAQWISRRETAEVGLSLDRAGVTEAQATWDAAQNHDPATTAASFQTLAVVMYPYGDPTVLAQAEETGISAARLLDGEANTLFIVSPSNQQERLRPLFTSLIAEMVDEAMTNATASPSGRLDPPLLVIVDDVGSCVPPVLLDQLASVGAGLGIQLMTLFQDLGQVERAVGTHQAVPLANNHRARVALPGISDGATLNYMNSLVRGARMEAPGGAVPSAAWLRTLEDGEAVCVYGNLPPLKMTLRQWFSDPDLKNRVEPPPEQTRRITWGKASQDSSNDASWFPNPFDSDANDREAARYWDAVSRDGVLPEPAPYREDASDPD
jgi:hypothetical protein